MSSTPLKAIIIRENEDYWGPCNCGCDVSTWDVRIPRAWLNNRPDIDFFRGEDYRRQTGFSCNKIFEAEYEDELYWVNFSCCKECAEKAVRDGLARWWEQR